MMSSCEQEQPAVVLNHVFFTLIFELFYGESNRKTNDESRDY